MEKVKQPAGMTPAATAEVRPERVARWTRRCFANVTDVRSDDGRVRGAPYEVAALEVAIIGDEQ